MARATRLVAATHRLMNSPEGETSDRVLIDRFAQARDERAFAELVERHGPLVHSVCRRLLRDAATAADVFQATFLVLAQEAGRAKWRTTIGPWLYTIAVRLARKAQSRRTGAPLDTATAAELAAPGTDPSEPLVWDEVKGALDDEMAQLPTALSQPLVLCYLQGLTRDEAARLLGISLAKLKRNLNRGRNLLHARLSRRGITLAAAGWGIALTTPPLSAEMRQRVIRLACDATQASTTPAAVQELIAGCTPTRTSRWLLAPVVLAVGLSVTALAFALRPAEPPPAPTATKPVDDNPSPDAVAQKEAPMDPLPDGAVMRFGSLRLSDSTIYKAGAFSPDGKLFATSLCVWDAATGKLVRRRQNPFTVRDLRWRADGLAAVTEFAFTPDVFLMQLFGEEKGINFSDERLTTERLAIAANPSQDRLEMTSVFLSGDGKWVFATVVSQDGKARRLERFPFTENKTSVTVKPDRELPYPGGLSGAWARAWASHDGRTVIILEPAAGDQPARLLAYDLAAEKSARPVWEKKVPAGKKPWPAVEACLLIDGKRVVILSSDGAVEVWDGPAGKRIRELPKMPRDDFDSETRRIDLTPDGTRVAMLFRNPAHEIGGRVLEIETGKEVCTLIPQPLPLGGVARISPDGKQVAQIAYGVARIRNAETGAPTILLPGHNGHVTALLPTADGKRIISAGFDLTVREWNSQTGKETWRTTFANFPVPLFVTPEGVVVQEQNIRREPEPGWLLDPKTGKREPLPGALGAAKTTRPNSPNSPPTPDALLALTPDGKTIVTLAQHTLAFRTWAWPSGELKTTCLITPPQGLTFFDCREVHVTPDGKQLVALMRYLRSVNNNFQRQPVFVERWDLVSGKMLARADGSDPSPPKLIPYADGVLILDVCDKFSEPVPGGFNMVPGGFNNLGGLTLPRGPQTHVAGDLRDTVSGVRVVRLTLPPWKELPDLQRVCTGALSPDGRVLALGTDYDTVWLFEMRTGKHFRALHPEGRALSALRFLPDGRLVTASDTALVWPTGLQKAEGTEELATLWAEFADSDPMKARPAMAKMAGRGARAVEFIRGRVQPVPKLKADVAQIVKALGSDVLKERDAASAELDKLGAPAVAAVQAQLRTDVSDEVRARAKRFLDKYDSGALRPEELQVLRAIEVLEVIGGADARAALESLAAGEPSARATRDVAGAVRRLNGTPPAKNAR
jgi:RNA polymerase sigma factor (sigma-70 family)